VGTVEYPDDAVVASLMPWDTSIEKVTHSPVSCLVAIVLQPKHSLRIDDWECLLTLFCIALFLLEPFKRWIAPTPNEINTFNTHVIQVAVKHDDNRT
jgi:hypothetical protein